MCAACVSQSLEVLGLTTACHPVPGHGGHLMLAGCLVGGRVGVWIDET